MARTWILAGSIVLLPFSGQTRAVSAPDGGVRLDRITAAAGARA